jgi:hypothetical protein
VELSEGVDETYVVVIVGILRPGGGSTTEVDPIGPGGRMYQGPSGERERYQSVGVGKGHQAVDVVAELEGVVELGIVGEDADTVGIGRPDGGRITNVVVGVITGLWIVTVLETGGGEGKM